VASLLQNLYPVQGGRISIGKYDIKHISNISLRKIISVVPQKIDLFSGNITENIAVGELAPDMERVYTVCERLGMLRFIESLPNGFGTYIGENGAALSGGQKQRIAIARALYRDPEILILDEATSSLDSMAESFVHETIRLMKEENRTVVIIAHRLSTISMADRIIVLEKGNVIQEGTFSELSESEGHFRRMMMCQKFDYEEVKTLN
jgi:ATP-binding cassette subfamily B protein